MENQKFDADVLIIGAGPVGLTLGLGLGRQGTKAIMIDLKAAPLHLPKMERSNPRTMEIYRRLGVVDRLRAAGYPADMPMDCYITASLASPPLVHQRYPSVGEAKAAIAACTNGSLPREPYQLISQYTLEPILLDELRRQPSVDVKFNTALLGFEQDAEGVTSHIQLSDGTRTTLRTRYLTGCDGGNSLVRKTLGISLQGKGGLATVTQVFFRSDDFYEKCAIGPGRHYSFVGRSHGGMGVGGVIVVQDDRKHFTLQTSSPEGTDYADEIRRTTSLPIEVEILYTGQWTQHMLVAERYGEGRVFLAGDANHLYIPAGGLGMNTGIGDAFNLSWKLAAMAAGWGGAGLPESYFEERRHVGERNRNAVWYAIEGVIEWRNNAASLIFDESDAGKASQQAFAEIAEPLNRRVYEMHGTELGYRYSSAVIGSEHGDPPSDDSYEFHPSTFPGRHLPHVWLDDGAALYDKIGSGFTLLKLGGTNADTQALEQAMRDLNVPFEVMTICEPNIRKCYEQDLLLVRPDLHVAWRGNALPENPRSLACMVTGWM